MANNRDVPNSSENDPPLKILTDEFDNEPSLDFDRYVRTVVRIVKGSEPNLSIGIHGEWGTGKTTLMKSIENRLKSDQNILTIWFNAWRYEREEQFALVSLMKTIAYELDNQPKYKKAKEVLLRSIITASKGLASKYVLSEKHVDELQNNFTSDMKKLAEADKNTIYFQGLKQIEDEMKEILQKSPESRIVVFIDDLDRCTPKKALEVFESIKVFLDIKGFIYIIGLSHETITKLITAEYEKNGIMGIKGEQYIGKIIQNPITVPEWNSSDIERLIDDVIVKKLDKTYSKMITDNKDLILIASEENPRELKRFINSFIVSHEIFSSNEEIQPRHLLAFQVLKIRWPRLYRNLITSNDDEFRKSLQNYASMKNEDRIRALDDIKSRQKDGKSLVQDFEKKLGEIDDDPKLWNLLSQSGKIIFEREKWEIYRRAVESTKVYLPTDRSERYRCSRCQLDLRPDEVPCPRCGHDGREIILVVNGKDDLVIYEESVK